MGSPLYNTYITPLPYTTPTFAPHTLVPWEHPMHDTPLLSPDQLMGIDLNLHLSFVESESSGYGDPTHDEDDYDDGDSGDNVRRNPRYGARDRQRHYDKKVFPHFYILGWYSTGSDAEESDMLIHKALMDINESPVYVLLNPSVNHSQKDLPVSIFESELHVIDGIPQLIFVRSSYTIETVEAERISVDHVAHLKPSDGGSAATQLAAHLTGIHSAIKMLHSRIKVLHHYLLAMQKGDVPCENSLLRQVSSLLRRLPAIESGKFQDDFLMEYNDTLLVSYLAMLTNCSSATNELVDKFNTAYDRHSRRGGRTAFM